MELSSCFTAPRVQGKCTAMCPKSEAKFREANNLLSIFESPCLTDDGNGKQKCGQTRCVKEFRRSAAGEKLNDPSLLRPAPVLLQTVDYLIEEVAIREDVSFAVVYDFVFDRLRSVRQDMVIQELRLADPAVACQILEKCLRFYIFANFKINQRDIRSVDRHIHRTQTQQCFRALLEVYQTSGQLDDDAATLVNAADFLACYLFFNLGSHEILFEVLTNYPRSLRTTCPLSSAIRTSFAFVHNNFVNIFKCLSKLRTNGRDMALLCLVDNIAKCRTKSVAVLSHSHNSKALSFPPKDLLKWLYLDDEKDARTICEEHGMKLNSNGNVCFLKENFVPPVKSAVKESNLNGIFRDRRFLL